MGPVMYPHSLQVSPWISQCRQESLAVVASLPQGVFELTTHLLVILNGHIKLTGNSKYFLSPLLP